MLDTKNPKVLNRGGMIRAVISLRVLPVEPGVKRRRSRLLSFRTEPPRPAPAPAPPSSSFLQRRPVSQKKTKKKQHAPTQETETTPERKERYVTARLCRESQTPASQREVP